MLGNVPSGCVYSFDTYEFRLGDEILVADGGKIVERLTAAYRLDHVNRTGQDVQPV